MDDQNHVVFVGRYISRVNVLLQYKMIHYCVIHSGDLHSVTHEVHKLWYPKKKNDDSTVYATFIEVWSLRFKDYLDIIKRLNT